MAKNYYVYLMTNERNTVLYTGITSDLSKRVAEHKSKITEGFTKKYNIQKLVYYEVFEDIKLALQREKKIKGGSRKRKMDLIDQLNPNWDDICVDL